MEYIIIVAVVVLFYIRTIEYSLIIDDWRNYTCWKNGHYSLITDTWKQASIFKKIKLLITHIRQRLYASCTFGTNTIIDHAFTTLLHAITCCLIYALWPTTIGLWASLLYAVNPVNSQTAVWMNGRRYQVVIILCLLALIFKPFGFIFYLLTPLFQFTGLFLPVLFFDISPLFLLAPVIMFIIKRKDVKEAYQERMKRIWNTDQKTWSWHRIMVVIKTYGLYLYRMIHPRTTFMIYPELVKWGLTKEGNKDAYSYNVHFVVGVCSLAVTIGLLFINDLRLYALFIILGTLQWSAIFCGFQQLTDRYISLVNVFVMYCLSYALWMLPEPYAIGCLMGLFGYYATQLNVTMKMYQDIMTFHKYHLFLQPDLTRMSVIYAGTFMEAKDVTRAWEVIRNALEYDPTDFELVYRAADCSASVGLIDKCDEFIDIAYKNFYIGQETIQTERLNNLIKKRNDIAKRLNSVDFQGKMNGAKSRQLRRAEERKAKT